MAHARTRLSPRESELLILASEGNTDVAIAHKLGISESTVNTYWARIRAKLGPHSRTELVAEWLKEENDRALRDVTVQNSALRQRLHDIETSRDKDFLRRMFHDFPDAVLVADSAGTIHFANHQVGQLFGYAPEALVGKHVSMLVPEQYRTQHRVLLAEYMQAPRRLEMSHHEGTYGLHKNGNEFPIQADLAAVESQHGRMAICVIRPTENYYSRETPLTIREKR